MGRSHKTSKSSKSKNEKSGKHSKNEFATSTSKKWSHKAKKHEKEDSVPVKVHKHEKYTRSGVKPSSSSADGSSKMSERNSKNEISMVGNEMNKSLETDKQSMEPIELKVPQNASNKYKRITCATNSDSLSSDDDSDTAKVENSMPRIIYITDSDSSVCESSPNVPSTSEKDCFNKGSERKDIKFATKPSLVQEVSHPEEHINSTSTKIASHSTQETQGSDEVKPIKPESFLPKETMRLRKKIKVAPIKKRRNTMVFPHICADDDDDSIPVIMATSQMNEEIETHEDGEISSSSDEFDDGYDENFMGDQSDRERLSKLSEINRELEIYRRSEEREIGKRHWEILRRIRKNAASEANKITETSGRSLKRKEELEKVNSKNERSTAMAALVKQRERKYNHTLEHTPDDDKLIPEEENEILPHVAKRRKSTVKLRASDVYSDESCSEDDIIETSPPTPVMIPNIKTVQELNQIFISRTNIEKLLYLPIFQKTVLHSFVRVKSGSNIHESNYFVAEIIGFQECTNVYTLGNTISNTYLQLKSADNSLSLSMVYISNEQFKESEFQKWLVDCERKNVPLPNLEDAKNKMEEITNALNYNVTEKDINKMVERKTALRQCPKNIAMERACLLKDRHSATHNGDNDHVLFLNQKIKELERLNGNKDRIIQRRHTLYMPSPLIMTSRPEHNLSQEDAANPYNPYTRRPTRPHKVVTSVGNKDYDKFLMPPPK